MHKNVHLGCGCGGCQPQVRLRGQQPGSGSRRLGRLVLLLCRGHDGQCPVSEAATTTLVEAGERSVLVSACGQQRRAPRTRHLSACWSSKSCTPMYRRFSQSFTDGFVWDSLKDRLSHVDTYSGHCCRAMGLTWRQDRCREVQGH